MNIRGKIATAVATGAFIMGTFASSAFAATNVEISGNGAFSDNTVRINQSQNTSINQRNNATISNNVSVHSNTGNNNANFNTGGRVFISTGDINSSVRIHNNANMNRVLGDRHDRDGNRYIHIRGDLCFDRLMGEVVRCPCHNTK